MAGAAAAAKRAQALAAYRASLPQFQIWERDRAHHTAIARTIYTGTHSECSAKLAKLRAAEKNGAVFHLGSCDGY
jgi:hypothetical protein